MGIAIVGAGRSGTSMLSGMLHQCGLDFGQDADLLPGDQHNPFGYYESRLTRDVTEGVLAYLIRKYGNPALAQPGWENDSGLAANYEAAAGAIAHFGQRSSNWCWKYPSASLTIPFWRRACPEMRYILCVRNPIDVAASFAAKEGFSTTSARNLWLYTTARVLLDTDPEQRMIVFYEDFFPDYRKGLQPVLDFVCVTHPEPGSEIDRRLHVYKQDSFKHNSSSREDLQENGNVTTVVKRLYIELLEGPSDASALPVLDLADIFMPFVARAVAFDFERRHLAQILNSRTHRFADLMCRLLIRWPGLARLVTGTAKAGATGVFTDDDGLSRALSH